MALENPYYEPWVQSAACRTIGFDHRCPVLADCRDWVMRTELGNDHKTRFGVAAGMPPLERKKYEPQWLTEQQGAA